MNVPCNDEDQYWSLRMPRDLLAAPKDRTPVNAPSGDSKTTRALKAKVDRLNAGKKVGRPTRIKNLARQRGIPVMA